jgi:hypothetical protein
MSGFVIYPVVNSSFLSEQNIIAKLLHTDVPVDKQDGKKNITGFDETVKCLACVLKIP